MHKYIFLIISFFSQIFVAMETPVEWLVRPSMASTNEYRTLYERLFEKKLSKRFIKKMRNYERVRNFKKNIGQETWIKNELFQHILSNENQRVKVASFILSGIEKGRIPCPGALTGVCFQDSPLHYAVRIENKTLIAALLLQNADVALKDCTNRTPLQFVKRTALKKNRFSELESCLKRYIWHKHVLLHKRFSEKWGTPFTMLPAEVVAIIAEKAYGSYT